MKTPPFILAVLLAALLAVPAAFAQSTAPAPPAGPPATAQATPLAIPADARSVVIHANNVMLDLGGHSLGGGPATCTRDARSRVLTCTFAPDAPVRQEPQARPAALTKR